MHIYRENVEHLFCRTYNLISIIDLLDNIKKKWAGIFLWNEFECKIWVTISFQGTKLSPETPPVWNH